MHAEIEEAAVPIDSAERAALLNAQSGLREARREVIRAVKWTDSGREAHNT